MGIISTIKGWLFTEHKKTYTKEQNVIYLRNITERRQRLRKEFDKEFTFPTPYGPSKVSTLHWDIQEEIRQIHENRTISETERHLLLIRANQRLTELQHYLEDIGDLRQYIQTIYSRQDSYERFLKAIRESAHDVKLEEHLCKLQPFEYLSSKVTKDLFSTIPGTTTKLTPVIAAAAIFNIPMWTAYMLLGHSLSDTNPHDIPLFKRNHTDPVQRHEIIDTVTKLMRGVSPETLVNPGPPPLEWQTREPARASYNPYARKAWEPTPYSSPSSHYVPHDPYAAHFLMHAAAADSTPSYSPSCSSVSSDSSSSYSDSGSSCSSSDY